MAVERAVRADKFPMFENFATSLWSAAIAVNLAVTGGALPAHTEPQQAPNANILDVVYSDSGTTTTQNQTITTASSARSDDTSRDAYTVVAPKPKPKPAPTPTVSEAVSGKSTTTSSSSTASKSTSSTPTQAPAQAEAPNVTPDPGSAQAEAWNQVQAFGWGQDQFNCLVALWNKESGWRVNAANSSSGAYGIPQSLPGSKMASAGADWQTNPATQIKWGLGYIKGSYGTPCGAWGHSQATGWY
jgi:hypothetical protein